MLQPLELRLVFSKIGVNVAAAVIVALVDERCHFPRAALCVGSVARGVFEPLVARAETTFLSCCTWLANANDILKFVVITTRA